MLVVVFACDIENNNVRIILENHGIAIAGAVEAAQQSIAGVRHGFDKPNGRLLRQALLIPLVQKSIHFLSCLTERLDLNCKREDQQYAEEEYFHISFCADLPLYQKFQLGDCDVEDQK